MLSLARMGEIILAKSTPEPMSGCWLWLGHLDRNGYGDYHATKSGPFLSAHRMAYQAFRGEIQDGMDIDHLCRVHCCVNPEHMEVVTRRVNTLRGVSPSAVNAAKMQCNKGHPLTGNNLMIVPNKARRNKARRCRACWRENSLAYKQQRRSPLVAEGVR